MATVSIPSMQDLLGAGVHFGHQVRRGHPKMGQYIYGAREGVHIIDLAKSEEKLKEATQFVYDLGKENKVLLAVGTKKQAKEIVESLAKEADMPYISARWVGGMLTNFDEVKKNLKKLSDLKDEKAKGLLTRYTKKERLLIDRRLTKFDLEFGGIEKLDKVPDAIFIVDAVAEKIALNEAQNMGVTIVGFADTNSNPNVMDYPIPANDDGIKSIKLITETIIRAYAQGKKEAGIKAEADSKKAALEKEKEDKKAAEKKVEPKKDEPKVAVAPVLDEAVKEEAAVIEEEIEKKVLQDSERKVE